MSGLVPGGQLAHALHTLWSGRDVLYRPERADWADVPMRAALWLGGRGRSGQAIPAITFACPTRGSADQLGPRVGRFFDACPGLFVDASSNLHSWADVWTADAAHQHVLSFRVSNEPHSAWPAEEAAAIVVAHPWLRRGRLAEFVAANPGSQLMATRPWQLLKPRSGAGPVDWGPEPLELLLAGGRS